METMTADQISDLITPDELAHKLAVSRDFVKKYTQRRRLPGMVRCGRCWRFRRSEVDKAILRGAILIDS